jgi:hypothetical protein
MLIGQRATKSKVANYPTWWLLNFQRWRWLEHFCQVFDGNIKPMSQLQCVRTSESELAPIASIDVFPSRTQDAISRLGCNKGVGRDGLPAELLRTGGAPVAIRLSEVYLKIITNLQWPLAWGCGALVDVYKRKGNMEECDNHRGVLRQVHMAKGLAEILDEHVKPAYTANALADQFGATSGWSTDMATHLVCSFIEVCTARTWSMFVLSIDLIKAFGRAIRELVLGLPCSLPEVGAYLSSLELEQYQVDWFIELLVKHRSVQQS